MSSHMEAHRYANKHVKANKHTMLKVFDRRYTVIHEHGPTQQSIATANLMKTNKLKDVTKCELYALGLDFSDPPYQFTRR